MRRFIFICLCIVFALLMTHRLYLRDNVMDSLKNERGSVFLYFPDTVRSAVKVLSSKGTAQEKRLPHCRDSDSKCLLFTIKTELFFQKAEIRFQSDQSGPVEIVFMGPLSEKLKNRQIEVDFKNFYLDGAPVFHETETGWRHFPIVYGFNTEKGKPVSISFEYRRHLPDSANVDWFLFMTIIVVSGLIGGRIEKGFFAFFHKAYDGATKGQKIFLTIFFLILCVPALRINPDDRSFFENRTLTAKPGFIMRNKNGENGLFLKYGEYFGFWFNDRFLGRLQALSVYHFLQKHLRFRLKTPKGFVGKDKDIFQTRDLEIFDAGYVARLKKYSNRYGRNLKKMRQWAEKNNIKLYMVIVPVKESILYSRLGKGVPGDTREYDRWVEKLRRKSGIDIVYPKKELLRAARTAKDLLFFKQDHHYTEYGAFLIYRELMKRIKRDYPDIPVLSENDFDVFYDDRVRHGYDMPEWQKLSHLCTTLMIFNEDECREYARPYRYYQYRQAEKVRIKKINEKITRYFNPDGKYSLYILGTSHVNQLSSIMPFAFKRAVKEVGEDRDITKNNVLPHKPDILVLVLQSTVFDKLDRLFKE